MTTTLLARDKYDETVQCLKPGTTQTVAISGTSAAMSSAVAANTVVIRLVATTNCFVKIAASPTATTADMPLIANVPEYFRIDENQSMKVAGIQMSAAGSLYITEMS